MGFPQLKRRLEVYLSSEEGSIISKKVVAVGGIVAATGLALASQNVSAHTSHCSGGVNSYGYSCTNDGVAGTVAHSTHGTHGSHVSHGTHSTHTSHGTHSTHGSHATHSTHGSHSSHGNHSTHATHNSHCTHGTHGSHGSHGSHSSY